MFEIKRVMNRQYPVLVVANSYVSPLSCLNLIALSLKDNAFRGKILFDLLCSNGLEDNRFISIDFDGNQFIRNTFHVLDVEELPQIIVKSQNDFFTQNPHVLLGSVLSNSEISQITSRK